MTVILRLAYVGLPTEEEMGCIANHTYLILGSADRVKDDT